MANPISAVGGTPPVAPTKPVRRTGDAKPTGFPSSPPDEVRAQVETAGATLDQLAARGIGMRLVIDGDAVSVSVVDAQGNVLQQAPASSVVDALAGGGVTVDRLG
jgi:hypothetical protein